MQRILGARLNTAYCMSAPYTPMERRFISSLITNWHVLRSAVLLALWATPAAAQLEIIALDEQPKYVAEDKAVARELVSPGNSSVENLSIAEITVPVGVSIVPHHHHMEEIYHILEGEGIVMVEDEKKAVVAGDSVVIAPHQWHNIENTGTTDIRMFVTCVPAWAPEHLIFERRDK